MEAHAKLHIPERLISASGSPMIFGDGLRFHVPFILDYVWREPVLQGSGNPHAIATWEPMPGQRQKAESFLLFIVI